VKIIFPTASRPISARPGYVTKIVHAPGPSDYKTVDTNTYMKQSRVIPSISFPTQMRFSKSQEKFDVRGKSPAPNLYRPKSAAILLSSPSATIGRT
jgi:hypothetical protein